MKNSYDVVVIGAGSAGYAAARTAAAEGASVLVVESGQEIGGLCILRGCMPTKALLESSHRLHEIARAKEFGIKISKPTPLPLSIQKRRALLIEDFASYRRDQLTKSKKFHFVRAHASFAGAHSLSLTLLDNSKKTSVKFKKCIIATGSTVTPSGIPRIENIKCWTSDDAILAKKIPTSLTVLGGGAVAVELAQHFARLGSKVTILQRNKQLLSGTDPDLAAVLQTAFEREGIRVITGCNVTAAEKKGTAKIIHYLHKEKKHTISSQEVLFARGRRPATDSLNCQAAGIELDNAAVRVGPDMRTTNPDVFAVGDVNGIMEVVHIAIQQGEIAARNAVRHTSEKWDDRLKALVVFTDPNIATVGLSENECTTRGIPYVAASYPFSDHGKSMIRGALLGHVKIIANPSDGTILGAAVAGPEGGELIHELIVAMASSLTVKQFAAIPHYHPTLSEIWTYPAEEILEKISQ
jgi:pyruvate/2-oxoglutarate dehydrogenase complex dihydrolipoamide dehydrogenase (E3) component